jgi:hypothetical protein
LGDAAGAEKLVRTVFVVTGNRLRDGRVLYLRADRTWSHDLDAAELLDAAARDARLEWAPSQRLEVTGIYALEVGFTTSGARLLSARERFRAQGEITTRRRLGIREVGDGR